MDSPNDCLMYADNVRVDIGKHNIIKGISLGVRPDEILTIIGPNGSGKSTLLKGMCRLLRLSGGHVTLKGRELSGMNSKTIARSIAILPQKKNIPADITVERLVQYGRAPYARFGGRLTGADFEVIERMMRLTGVDRMRLRSVATLSGGESQMAWITMALAQQPEILFLDEPTTFLDISYQLAVLELVRQIQREQKLSVVMVLHDLNQAALYSDRIAVVKDGVLTALGTPEELYRDEMFRDVFRVETEKVSYGDGKTYYLPTKMVPKEQKHA